MSLSICGVSSFINNRIVWNYGAYYNNDLNLWNESKTKLIQKDEYSDSKIIPVCAGLLKVISHADYLKRKFKFNLEDNLIWIITSDKDIFELFKIGKNYSNSTMFKKYYDRLFKKAFRGISAVFVHPTTCNIDIPSYNCYFEENEILNKNIKTITATSNQI